MMKLLYSPLDVVAPSDHWPPGQPLVYTDKREHKASSNTLDKDKVGIVGLFGDPFDRAF